MDNRIDKIRAKKKLSYGIIAKESGLTATYVRFLAKGVRNNPSLDVMRRIANALGEPINSVFKFNQVV